MKKYIVLIAAAMLIGGGAWAARPNIVLIMVDDKCSDVVAIN